MTGRFGELSSIDMARLSSGYASGELTPEAVLDEVYCRIELRGQKPVWITLVPSAEAQKKLAAARRRKEAGEDLPLFGIPFAVKDNIDVLGLPTTAACPEIAYLPERSATVVEKLEQTGAILIGKTNLDQFATGLVGTRSPYGICASVFDPAYISGGSSSGSAVAVAAGLVSFALGTDTAGSGRVPAAFNNIVGLKPSKGLISTRGLVPACRSQDCISVFAGSVGDALSVLRVAAGFDPEDAYSRRPPAHAARPEAWPAGFRFGVPAGGLEFFGDDEAERLYEVSIERLRGLGGTPVAFDFEPFRQAAQLLYGPFVAERTTALARFPTLRPEAMDPVVRQIVMDGPAISGADLFAAQHRLAELGRAAEREWSGMEAMLLPTTGTLYKIAEILADPIALNSNLGRYTNFVNLLDFCATAVPAGFRANGLPFGVTLIGRAFEDGKIALLADRLHRALPEATIGASGVLLPESSRVVPVASPGGIALAVVGAHLSGQPLNWQLTSRGGRLLETARLGAGYSLFALPGTLPPKPGLVFDRKGAGGIEIEIWELDAAGFGSFVAEIPPPLGIGTATLADGRKVKSFLSEAYAVSGAEDITAYGGWRNYLRQVTAR